MRTFDDLVLRFVIGLLIALASCQALAGCGSPKAAALGVSLPRMTFDALVLDLPAPKHDRSHIAAPIFDERVTWCEPLDPAFCRVGSDCPTDTQCVRPWWAETDESKVCARPSADRSERRWRADRLRVVVDHVCSRATGCEPNNLHAYLRLLALRESSWRPWKRHRLDHDRKANAAAWAKHRHKFAGNPAQDPDRWSTGLGYYSQIPALWLPLWDRLAPPEVLCGEVESTEVHLRAARAQIRKIERGVDCDGDGKRDFFGTACVEGDACEPSWYDASRVNSGSLCPGDAEHRRRFEARAAEVGLDPWASISADDLGVSIPIETQDDVADELRVRMLRGDALANKPWPA